jgi:TIR domain
VSGNLGRGKVPPAMNDRDHAAAARMSDASDGKRDFFVSFNQADRPWAAWIVRVLRDEGYSLWFQDDDFKGNFIAHMEQAHALPERRDARPPARAGYPSPIGWGFASGSPMT